MPRGHRHMYYLTGLPGWMRFGYSPGWGGMPPGAAYIMTGQWPTPQAQAYWQAMQSGQAPFPQYGPGAPSSYPGFQPPQGPMMTREQELDLLKNQAQFLKQQMEQIDVRIKELEQEET
jgi:hypothetical protein